MIGRINRKEEIEDKRERSIRFLIGGNNWDTDYR